MVVTNNGPSTATGVVAADTLPASVTFVSASSTQGTCSQAGGVVTCNIGTMAAGASVTITVVVTPTATGTILNTVVVVGQQPESNTANNRAEAPTLVVGVVTPPTVCSSLSITPRQLQVGKRSIVVARVRGSDGKPMARARVRLSAPGIAVTKRTNGQGIARFTVKPRKSGILRVTVLGSTTSRCSARSGIVGVFQPPVTG
jgi:hypothetical protein